MIDRLICFGFGIWIGAAIMMIVTVLALENTIQRGNQREKQLESQISEDRRRRIL